MQSDSSLSFTQVKINSQYYPVSIYTVYNRVLLLDLILIYIKTRKATFFITSLKSDV